MARQHRIEMPGIVYHVYDRGNEKMRIFRDDLEKKNFLVFLKKIKDKMPFKLHAYVLMNNHYHLLIEPCDIPVSNIMPVLKTKYSHYFNFKHNRVGHLYESRYKCLLVEDDEYLLSAIRYIHLNPVKAGIVKSIDDYEWSSHAELIGRSGIGLLDQGLIKNIFSNDGNDPVREYRAFMGHAWKKDKGREIEEYFDRMVFGTKQFAVEILQKAKSAGLRVRDQAFRGDWADTEEILDRTAEVFEVKREEMIKKKGKWNIAKPAAIYLLWKNTSLSPAEIAEIFNKQHPSGIKGLIRSAEEKMDKNAEYRELVNYIENSVVKGKCKGLDE
jgi:REP element-mobilizing transposase RayT